METHDLLIQIKADIAELKKALPSSLTSNLVSDKWLPRSEVMRFFSYGDTQMGALEKTSGIVVTKVGKRKFFHRDSITRLLEKNIISNP